MTARLESTLTRVWMRRGPLAALLLPFAFLFYLLTALRRSLYRARILRSVRLPVPVVIVGNIFVGGTGKTPLTIWLVDELKNAGFIPGVISRGYGTAEDAPRVVTNTASAITVGDEPALVARRTGCPVVVGRKRTEAARLLLQEYPAVNLIISDDGLQHYALQRDVEVLLSDERGIGNGWLLPAGPLRESPSRRRDFTVIHGKRPCRTAAGTFYMQLAGDMAERLSDPLQTKKLQAMKESRIVAAAGIGNPSRFFAMLRSVGLVVEELPLPDHYDFAENPFKDVQADVILITEKDAVKCRQLDTMKNDPRIWVVPVTARIDAALAEQIVEKCRGRPTA